MPRPSTVIDMAVATSPVGPRTISEARSCLSVLTQPAMSASPCRTGCVSASEVSSEMLMSRPGSRLIAMSAAGGLMGSSAVSFRSLPVLRDGLSVLVSARSLLPFLGAVASGLWRIRGGESFRGLCHPNRGCAAS